MSIESYVRNYVKKIARQELENEADKVKRQLIREANVQLANYYSFPEGTYYVRTGKFKNGSFKPYEKKNTRNLYNMVITVGVIFERDFEYYGAGVDSETIYTWNLSGEHGGNGNSGNILSAMNAFADAISG